MSDFRLTDIDRNTPLWLALRAYLERRLESQRAKNDTDLSPDETAKVRGRIAEIKALLALENPRPEIPAD